MRGMAQENWKLREHFFGLSGLAGLLFYVFLGGSLALAVEKHEDPLPTDIYTIHTQRNNTNRNVEHVSVVMQYRNHRRDLFFPYAEETRHRWDLGFNARVDFGDTSLVNYFVVGGHFLLSHRIPKKRMQFDGYFGFRNFSNKLNSERSFMPSARVNYYWVMSRRMKLHSELAYDFAVTEVYQLGVIERLVKKLHLRNQFSFRPKKRLRVPFTLEMAKYSDANTQHLVKASALYGFLPTWPWLWWGVTGEWQAFSRQKADYFSPSSYLSYGIQMEAAFSIVKKLYGSADLEVNRHSEKPSQRSRVGFFLAFELQYGDREDLNATLRVSREYDSKLGAKFVDDSMSLVVSTPL